MDRSGSGIYNGSPTSARHCKLLLRLFLSKILKSLSSLNNSTCINMFPFSACYVKRDKFQYNAQLLQYPKILKYFCLSRLYCLLNVRAHKGLLQFLTFWMNVKYMDSSLRSFQLLVRAALVISILSILFYSIHSTLSFFLFLFIPFSLVISYDNRPQHEHLVQNGLLLQEKKRKCNCTCIMVEPISQDGGHLRRSLMS